MTSIIKFTPLCGALEQPLCFLLEIDELRILLDCGWNDSYDLNLLKPLARIAPKGTKRSHWITLLTVLYFVLLLFLFLLRSADSYFQ
jgi:hypothetical protein